MSFPHVPLAHTPTAHPSAVLVSPSVGPHRLGRVLGQEEALALGKELLSLVRSTESFGLWIEHTARAVTTVSKNHLRGWTVGDELAIWFDSRVGSGWPVRITTNDLTPVALRRVVQEAVAMIAGPGDRINPDDERYTLMQPRAALPVAIWHDTTARAMETPAAELLGQMVAQVEAAQLTCAATAVLTSKALCYLYQPGLTAWSRETDSELTITTRSTDGTASNWAGTASRDWTRLTPTSDAITAEAITWTQRSRNPSAMEPGRRTVILSPTAVGQLVAQTAGCFDAGEVASGQSPFSVNKTPGSHAWNKIGQRVMDPRLRLVSDPADPGGGFPPFYEYDEFVPEIPGLPFPAMTWIEGGVLKNLAFGSGAAGRQWCSPPHSARFDAVPGTPMATVEEMIADCAEGFYVHRLSDMHSIDLPSGTVTGTTRDGCFFIKHGKLERPAKNFWFLESPVLAFNRVIHVGQSRRVALGPDPRLGYALSHTPPHGRFTRWPRLPISAPALMIQDWNFNALADAV